MGAALERLFGVPRPPTAIAYRAAPVTRATYTEDTVLDQRIKIGRLEEVTRRQATEKRGELRGMMRAAREAQKEGTLSPTQMAGIRMMKKRVANLEGALNQYMGMQLALESMTLIHEQRQVAADVNAQLTILVDQLDIPGFEKTVERYKELTDELADREQVLASLTSLGGPGSYAVPSAAPRLTRAEQAELKEYGFDTSSSEEEEEEEKEEPEVDDGGMIELTEEDSPRPVVTKHNSNAPTRKTPASPQLA